MGAWIAIGALVFVTLLLAFDGGGDDEGSHGY